VGNPQINQTALSSDIKTILLKRIQMIQVSLI